MQTTIPPSCQQRTRQYWFAFGDSWSATGFQYQLYTTLGIKSDGKYYSPLAIAGATIDNSLATWGFGDMTSQIDAFQLYYASRPASAPWTADNTVASFWIGVNDVYYGFAHNDDPSVFVSRLMNRYRSLIEQIYSNGIRKFLFVNCPPSTRSPQVHEENDLPEQFQRHAEMATAYNEGLNSMLFQFRDEHKDATVVFYDSFQYMTRVLDDPAEYSYQDATCMNTDRSSCVWWNNLHLVGNITTTKLRIWCPFLRLSGGDITLQCIQRKP
ncbi:conserved hypothetical protein [Talaromyces stipitatus ATCC 10500]|uniref:Cellulose-binding GDSL lipase/acylhydrolase n=1 Tax=Talaromyces stipitatus (strain ATCC 10500 / CBS 375.48 / QM 6759 / NRRL 1006) TaxID=441959 RepID=B8MFC1_TALSN|nr:uncharacterized protein TSTA_017300 [Talaromyces stipitatus ATCC 10500]EED16655.1 conserved hypothetical protein [Talaromyces stipitatus ATCC 10500]